MAAVDCTVSIGVGTDVGCCNGAYSDRGGVENIETDNLKVKASKAVDDTHIAAYTWVTAKWSRELVLKESFTEKPCILRDQRMMSTCFLHGIQKKKNIYGVSAVCNSDAVLKEERDS